MKKKLLSLALACGMVFLWPPAQTMVLHLPLILLLPIPRAVRQNPRPPVMKQLL